jgi:hypothetical protein
MNFTFAQLLRSYRQRASLQLSDARQRLAHLRDPHDPQLDVDTSRALSYARLDAGTQQVFRQLGMLVADFTIELAQAVAGMPAGIDVARLCIPCCGKT